jgi:hypothetical protein
MSFNMSSMRKNFGRKLVSDKLYNSRDYETIMSAKLNQEVELTKIVNTSNYKTNGEEFIVVKDIPECRIILNSETTDHVIIKALTKVTIAPDKGEIDEDWDEVDIDRGACVEFYFIKGNWYIGSSDGIKMG